MNAGYLDQLFPKAEFSQDYSFESATSGTDLFIKVDHSQQGAMAILLHSVTIDMVNNDPLNTLTLLDNFNRKLLKFTENRQMAGFYPLNIIINAGSLNLILQNGNQKPGTMFTAQYQYIKHISK